MVLLGRVLAQGGSGAEGYSQTSMLGEGPLRWEGFAQGLRVVHTLPWPTEQERGLLEEGCPSVTGSGRAEGWVRVCAGLGLASAGGLWEQILSQRPVLPSSWCPPLNKVSLDGKFRLDWRVPGPWLLPPHHSSDLSSSGQIFWTSDLRGSPDPASFSCCWAGVGTCAASADWAQGASVGSAWGQGVVGGSGHPAVRLGGSFSPWPPESEMCWGVCLPRGSWLARTTHMPCRLRQGEGGGHADSDRSLLGREHGSAGAC